MSQWSRVRSATDEDLERHFPDGFVIGFPVRSPAVDKHEHEHEQHPEVDEQQGGGCEPPPGETSAWLSLVRWR
jgi:hypothetical protein